MKRENQPHDSNCPFCCLVGRSPLTADYRTVFAVNDIAPITPGHLLVITKRHTRDYFSMTREERIDAGELLKSLSEEIIRSDPTVIGFNVGSNCGEAAGQSVMHAHIHLIPRRSMDKPRWESNRKIQRVEF